MSFLIDADCVLSAQPLRHIYLGFQGSLYSTAFGHAGNPRDLKQILRGEGMPMLERCEVLAEVASSSSGSLNVGNVLLDYLRSCQSECLS